MKYMLFVTCILLLAGCRQPEKKTASSHKPNILLIVADDLGFSDIGTYGGNIQTPVLDKLGKESMLFSNFHVLPTCSPTRSVLLTGNDNHVAGLGIMSEMDYPALHQLNLPGYSGALSKQVATLPELLSGQDYHTYMVGKWHLGEDEGEKPHERGFEESFILGTGGGSHWNDRKALAPPQHMEYFSNGKVVDLPETFYSSRDYTDTLLKFIDRHKTDQKPFFAFLSYTAVHDPLHAPEEYIAKYKGRFDAGWDSLWTERFNNLKTLGIVGADAKGFKVPAIPAWSKLPKEQQQAAARDMEVYAAMLDYMDMSIGRVFEYLKAQGMYDNTMIIFMSDNGANGAVASTYPGNQDGVYLETFDNSLDNRGKKGSYIAMGPGWAQASSAPFRYFKTFTSEGGIRAPLMIKMPGQTAAAGIWNRSLTHVSDIMPTILELTGTAYPATYKGQNLHALIGKSLLPLFQGKAQNIRTDEGIGYELFEMKAYIRGNWKILRLPEPMGTGQWQLYDINKDPGETTDVAPQNPGLVKELIDAWNVYAKQNSVHDHRGHYDSVYRSSY
jgi:arylsulfatase